MAEDLSSLAAGDEHYKAYVGPPLKYDLMGALQFTLLTACGLRSEHYLCDIGCGSLRAGKLLIPYLEKGHYCGLEPNDWLVADGFAKELGDEIKALKAPRFEHNANFAFGAFRQKFDFLIAQSIFSHAAPQQIEKCLQEVAAVLQPSGWFLATFVIGPKDYRGEEWVYPGCVEYRPETVKRFAQNAGLQATACSWPHPNGQSWFLIHHPAEAARANELKDFSLKNYEFEPPTKAPKPPLKDRIAWHLKHRLGLKK